MPWRFFYMLISTVMGQYWKMRLGVGRVVMISQSGWVFSRLWGGSHPTPHVNDELQNGGGGKWETNNDSSRGSRGARRKNGTNNLADMFAQSQTLGWDIQCNWKAFWKKTSSRQDWREGNSVSVKGGIPWRKKIDWKGRRRKNGFQLSMLSFSTNHYRWWIGAIKANIQFFQFTWKEGHNILLRGRNSRLPNSVYNMISFLQYICMHRNSLDGFLQKC